jgi:hypothetical protein
MRIAPRSTGSSTNSLLTESAIPDALSLAFARDHEYKRYGTVSLLAGIDLLTGKVHALVRDRHRSREFIEVQATNGQLTNRCEFGYARSCISPLH